MGAILYQTEALTVIEANGLTQERAEDEVFALLGCDGSRKSNLLDFLCMYHSRYTHGATAILPNADVKQLDCDKIESLGLYAEQAGDSVNISYERMGENGKRLPAPSVVCIGEWELENVQDAIQLVKLTSYLMHFGDGRISRRHFEERCKDNDIDLRIETDDEALRFSVAIPPRYFAMRDENASDLLTFKGDRAIVQAGDLLMYDLGIPHYPTGEELERLAATVLVEKLANERSVKPFWIDPLEHRIRKHEYTSLIAAVVEMCMKDRIAPCPVCGRLVARPKDSSSRFNCGVAGHQARYNNNAQKRVIKGDSPEELIDKFPYLKEATVRNWYH